MAVEARGEVVVIDGFDCSVAVDLLVLEVVNFSTDNVELAVVDAVEFGNVAVDVAFGDCVVAGVETAIWDNDVVDLVLGN